MTGAVRITRVLGSLQPFLPHSDTRIILHRLWNPHTKLFLMRELQGWVVPTGPWCCPINRTDGDAYAIVNNAMNGMCSREYVEIVELPQLWRLEPDWQDRDNVGQMGISPSSIDFDKLQTSVIFLETWPLFLQVCHRNTGWIRQANRKQISTD